MAQRALGCFEQLPDGNWICQQDAKIAGLACTVFVRRGQLFSQGTVFAGGPAAWSYANIRGRAWNSWGSPNPRPVHRPKQKLSRDRLRTA